MKTRFRWMNILLAVTLGLGAAIILAGSAARAMSVVDNVDLGITLHAPQHVAPGTNYEVNLAYSNSGKTPSPIDTLVTVTLPQGVQFVAATDRWGAPLPPIQVAGGVLTWELGSLQPGESGHISIQLQVDEQLAEGTSLTLLSEISSNAVEVDLDNNTACVTSLVCDMAGSSFQAQQRSGMPGDVISYTLRMQLARRGGMNGQQNRQVSLEVTLPITQVRFLGWGGQISGTQEGQALRWQGQVQAGEPLTMQYRLGVLGDVQPGEIISLQAQLRWGAGGMPFEPVTLPVTLTQNARMIGAQGGNWSHQEGLQIGVPPGAVTETTRFQYHPLVTGTQTITAPPGLRFAHHAFELTAFRFGEVHQFNKPISLTVTHTPTDVVGLNRETLRLWYRNGPAEPWAMLGAPQHVLDHSLLFTTTHFTEFALFGEPLVQYRLQLPLLQR